MGCLHRAILISIILCLPCQQRRYSCLGRNTAVWKTWAFDWGKTPPLRSPCGILHWSYWISTVSSGKGIHWRRKTHYPKYFKVPEEGYLTCLPSMWTHSVTLWAIFTVTMTILHVYQRLMIYFLPRRSQMPGLFTYSWHLI